MSRTQDLIGALTINTAQACTTRGRIAELASRIAQTRRALKSRKKRLWLDADCREINPAIDGKNAEIREGQHGAICAADPEVAGIVAKLDHEEAELAKLRAELANHRAKAQLVETELATYRAELNARAAECYGSLATTNGKTATAATATV